MPSQHGQNSTASNASSLQGLLGTPLNAVKGFLIALVVFGHIHIVQHSYRSVYDLIYIFHVAAFLTLPFLAVSPVLSTSFLQKRFVRYAVPFFWFFTLATLMFSVLYHLPNGLSLAEITFRYFRGLLIASAATLDTASGLKLFWFLPALFSLIVLRALYTGAPKARVFIFIACLAVNLLLGETEPWRNFIPWGALIAAYMLPVGIAAAYLVNYANKPSESTLRILLVLIAGFSLILAYQKGIVVNLGDMAVYGALSSPVMWLITNLAMVSSITAVFLLGRAWSSVPTLALLGSLSLPIYLIHGFINQLFEITVLKHLHLALPISLVIQYATVLAASTGLAWVAMRLPIIRQIIFPRDAADLRNWIHNFK